MLRWPALRRGLLVMPAVGVQKGAIARCALTGVRDRVLVLGRRGAAGRLHEIKQRSQQPVRAPRRSLLRLLRRPRRRCRQRQLVLETLGGAKASVLLGSRCRRRGLSLEAHGGLNPMPPALGSRLHASRWRSAQSPCTNYDRPDRFKNILRSVCQTTDKGKRTLVLAILSARAGEAGAVEILRARWRRLRVSHRRPLRRAVRKRPHVFSSF
jgi:hypothetical protein